MVGAQEPLYGSSFVYLLDIGASIFGYWRAKYVAWARYLAYWSVSGYPVRFSIGVERKAFVGILYATNIFIQTKVTEDLEYVDPGTFVTRLIGFKFTRAICCVQPTWRNWY